MISKDACVSIISGYIYNVFAYEQTVPKLQIEIRIAMLLQATISICHLASAYKEEVMPKFVISVLCGIQCRATSSKKNSSRSII